MQLPCWGDWVWWKPARSTSLQTRIIKTAILQWSQCPLHVDESEVLQAAHGEKWLGEHKTSPIAPLNNWKCLDCRKHWVKGLRFLLTPSNWKTQKPKSIFFRMTFWWLHVQQRTTPKSSHTFAYWCRVVVTYIVSPCSEYTVRNARKRQFFSETLSQ